MDIVLTQKNHHFPFLEFLKFAYQQRFMAKIIPRFQISIEKIIFAPRINVKLQYSDGEQEWDILKVYATTQSISG